MIETKIILENYLKERLAVPYDDFIGARQVSKRCAIPIGVQTVNNRNIDLQEVFKDLKGSDSSEGKKGEERPVNLQGRRRTRMVPLSLTLDTSLAETINPKAYGNHSIRHFSRPPLTSRLGELQFNLFITFV